MAFDPRDRTSRGRVVSAHRAVRMPTQRYPVLQAEQFSLGAVLLGTDVGPVTTPGTRVTWSNVREWIDASNVLHHRRAASKTYQQQAAHLNALTREVVERDDNEAALAELLILLRSRRYLEPRGRRGGTHRTRLVDYVHNRLQRLRAAAARDGTSTPTEERLTRAPLTG